MRVKKTKRGGVRSGAGRPYKWRTGGPTKLVRIPSAYVDKILELVSYMDANEGELPNSIFFALNFDAPIPGYHDDSLPYPRNPTDKF